MALKGEVAVFYFEPFLNNAADESLRLAHRVKINEINCLSAFLPIRHFS